MAGFYNATKGDHNALKEVDYRNASSYASPENEGLQLVPLPTEQSWYNSNVAIAGPQQLPPPRTILGVTVKSFWILVIVLVLILTVGIGGGVGGGLAQQKSNCAVLRYTLTCLI